MRFPSPALSPSPTAVPSAAARRTCPAGSTPGAHPGVYRRRFVRGGPDPKVDEAVPPEAPQNTTLDVRVLGANFDNGSTVRFLLDGKPTKNIGTNSTQFVGTGELVANITIALDAATIDYDIEVTTSKKRRGIGTELFKVEPATFTVEVFFEGTRAGGAGAAEVGALAPLPEALGERTEGAPRCRRDEGGGLVEPRCAEAGLPAPRLGHYLARGGARCGAT